MKGGARPKLPTRRSEEDGYDAQESRLQYNVHFYHSFESFFTPALLLRHAIMAPDSRDPPFPASTPSPILAKLHHLQQPEELDVVLAEDKKLTDCLPCRVMGTEPMDLAITIVAPFADSRMKEPALSSAWARTLTSPATASFVSRRQSSGKAGRYLGCVRGEEGFLE